MTDPTPAELLTLRPEQLAELVDAQPGDYVSTRAAALGLDLEIPAHQRALVAAFPDAFALLQLDQQPVSAGESGVRATLTPDPPAAPTPDTGEGSDPGTPESAAEPAGLSPGQIGELLARYRGSADPFLCGTFALYSAPDGSIVAVIERPDTGVEQHVLPARLVQLGLTAAAGKGNILGRMFS